MHIIHILSFVASLSLVFALPLTPWKRHESRTSLPHGWTIVGRARPETLLPLRVALAQPKLSEIGHFLLDVSHPDSPNYGAHWSANNVAETFRPSQESVDLVTTWLTQSGVNHSRIRRSVGGGYLEATITVAEAETLLRTTYYVYEQGQSRVKHIGCGSDYYLPAHVAKHIDLITPTLHFDLGSTHSKFTRSLVPGRKAGQPVADNVLNIFNDIKTLWNGLEHCDKQTSPVCLRELYNFHYRPLAANRNSLAIVEYTPQAYTASDMDIFFSNFSHSQIGQRPTLISIDGGIVQTNQTGSAYIAESNLDLQYAMALSGKDQEVTLYQVGDDVEGASFNNLLDALDGSYCTFEGGDDAENDGIYPDPDGYQGNDCGTVKPANIISSSYGYNEADLTPAYMQRQCAEYAKLGLMGVTVIYSSGDNGVAGSQDMCINDNGNSSTSGRNFNPSFPSTCPYVTSIGATQLIPGAKVTDKESAAYSKFSSGGGFSNVFAMPDYQKDAVNAYVDTYFPSLPAGVWNSTGSRAYPDLSANGANYAVAALGAFHELSGTSASAPTVAAILTAVNDARLAIGKRPIGFINPTIYSSALDGAFNDITNGTNTGCHSNGFSAQPGWDPVTGLGTPNFGKLVVKWLTLP